MTNTQLTLLTIGIPVVPTVAPVIVNIASCVNNRTRGYVRDLFNNFRNFDTSFRTAAFMTPGSRRWIVRGACATGAATICGMLAAYDQIVPYCSSEANRIIPYLWPPVTVIATVIASGIHYQFLHAWALTDHEREHGIDRKGHME